MSSRSTRQNKSSRRPRTRKELSRAELKAYEARRADEQRRVRVAEADHEPEQGAQVVATVHSDHSFALTRDEEFKVIKSDLKRLLIILAFITAILIVLTFVLG